MGLFEALIQSSSRFQGALFPVGCSKRPITWVINVSSTEGAQPVVSKKLKGELSLISPATPAGSHFRKD